MPTHSVNPNLFAFATAEGRPVVSSFDGGAITSDAGALLLEATDRVLGLTRRLAACFKDNRNPAYTEHALETLVMQRVVDIALGYEDLNDHDQRRHGKAGGGSGQADRGRLEMGRDHAGHRL